MFVPETETRQKMSDSTRLKQGMIKSIITVRISDKINMVHKNVSSNGVTKGEANGQLPISFEGLPIEILLFQNFYC